MRLVSLACSAALFVGAGIASAQAPAASSAQAQMPKYSTSRTLLGDLLADPAATAVLKARLPQLFVTFEGAGQTDLKETATGMTLKELSTAMQTYQTNTLNDKILAEIDADLAKIN